MWSGFSILHIEDEARSHVMDLGKLLQTFAKLKSPLLLLMSCVGVCFQEKPDLACSSLQRCLLRFAIVTVFATTPQEQPQVTGCPPLNQNQ